MNSFKTLSLIVPAYKQENTIVQDIKNLEKVLSSLPLKNEIIVVVDGFVDNTYKQVKKLSGKNIKIVGYSKNKGKGYAVRYGVDKANGDIIGFIDAGMDLDPREISRMINMIDWNNADIVIGSKLHPESKVQYPLARKILSWGYRAITHILFGFSIKDTQVGLKLFKRKVAKDVFSRILVKKFAFDIEVLAVAYKLGYKKIYESPIILDFTKASSITSYNFWRITLRTLWDTLAVFYRLKILHYYDK